MLILLFTLILSAYKYLVIAENKCQHCVSTTSWGSYDVTSVWLVLCQLHIARRPRHLFGTQRLLGHGPQNPGIY